MAKRGEYIKGNCPACGCGLTVDLDDLSFMAVGDTAKKPEQSERAKESEKPDDSGDHGKGSEADQPDDAAAGKVEAPTDKAADSVEGNEPDASSSKEASGLGDW